MKDVQCYELFGGIALKNHAFSFFRQNNACQMPGIAAGGVPNQGSANSEWEIGNPIGPSIISYFKTKKAQIEREIQPY